MDHYNTLSLVAILKTWFRKKRVWSFKWRKILVYLYLQLPQANLLFLAPTIDLLHSQIMRSIFRSIYEIFSRYNNVLNHKCMWQRYEHSFFLGSLLPSLTRWIRSPTCLSFFISHRSNHHSHPLSHLTDESRTSRYETCVLANSNRARQSGNLLPWMLCLLNC